MKYITKVYCYVFLAVFSTSLCAQTTLFFDALADQTASQFNFGVVTVSGSSDVHIQLYGGLGIIGGRTDNSIDDGESMTFSFSIPATAVSFNINSVSNYQDSSTWLEVTAEDPYSTSLGTVSIIGSLPIGNHNVSDLFSGATIGAFTLTARGPSNWGVRVNSLSGSSIPEPSTYAAIFGAIALLGTIAVRRRLKQA